jgi:hypothetical protein
LQRLILRVVYLLVEKRIIIAYTLLFYFFHSLNFNLPILLYLYLLKYMILYYIKIVEPHVINMSYPGLGRY